MREKGFTLIELLAVIVILAVIALIATPIIMNVINDSKKGAAKDAMYGYVKAVELAGAKNVTPTTDAPTGNYITKDGNIYNGYTKVMDVQVKGNKANDNGTLILKNGTVIFADLVFDNIEVLYNGSSSKVVGTSLNKLYTDGTVVYYNPETNKKCTSGEVNTADNAKTGCLKWNVITTDDVADKTSINVMLDHNTTGKVAWNSSKNSANGMNEVLTALASDILSWNTDVKSTARLIMGQEVANLVKNTVWTNDGNYITLSPYTWLYENLSGDNTAAQPHGYWTSTVATATSYDAWSVHYFGHLYSSRIDRVDDYGVRPVITISKSVIA